MRLFIIIVSLPIFLFIFILFYFLNNSPTHLLFPPLCFHCLSLRSSYIFLCLSWLQISLIHSLSSISLSLISSPSLPPPPFPSPFPLLFSSPPSLSLPSPQSLPPSPFPSVTISLSLFNYFLSLSLSFSGDDGIANSIIRKNKKLGCSKSWPDWPASSAFVTAVGATQLSNSYAPACTATYDV